MQTTPMMPLTSQIRAMLAFTLSLTKAMVRDLRVLLIGFATPAFMLIVFWLLDDGNTEVGGTSFILFVFPTLVSFSIMMAGGTLSQEIINWRQQGIFMRLGVTPVKKGTLLVGVALSHLFTSAVQAVLILAIGVLALNITISLVGTLAAFVMLMLAGSVFLAYGALIASLVREASVSTMVYFFTLFPMFFIGDGFMPADAFPGILGDIGSVTPVALTLDLIRELFVSGSLPDNTLGAAFGLVAYAVLFIGAAAAIFKWE